ncbi:dual specificity protein phosphatase 12 [Metschnikowia bicuspidata var. bicuspidata NRRL YB-4993]|uniref:protein-tyrosine-phosphatase n=1 Tax=Metschnikowia bicuspidata var. bicuspidata NRRL YB-4993 TaxID=869754 RepID=A0A1A0HHW2_9ASCO|nr:dual specificity protein phosphatase 12 [Metschnikowia bicuspidata var. bicuspidata NRRL YB-4993]OBA23591.1 dual specificity protein phosphatase 12 [Metschnikowia bicuspidata var. bicuspidata NRRL YB-4993]
MSSHVHRILGGIYLLSIEPINEGVDLQKDFQIASVVSVVPGEVPAHLQRDYQHLQIAVTDEDSSNLLDRLPGAMEFMDGALFGGGGDSRRHLGSVLVHCAQGQSRSVTVVAAYLMYKYKLSVAQALHAVRRKVAGAQPNEGFLEQLRVFEEMDCAVDRSSRPYRQFVVSSSLRRDPSGGQLRQQGVWPGGRAPAPAAGGPAGRLHLRCKRCRALAADMCSHHFVDEPMPWMAAELARQQIEGKLCCPRCAAKVGGYSWKGSRCSCGKWMVPALHLQAAKVDSMRAAASPGE